MVPEERLAQIVDRFEYLEACMAEGSGDIAALGREYAELRPVVEQIAAWRSLRDGIDEAEAMRDDPEMRALAEEELTELKARDREVRAHEAAHQAVGGQYAGAMSFTYQRGPDGAQYAVGGEVSIDLSPVQGDPQATIEKMRIVRAAAMAPAEPSGQDRAVAAQAMQIMLQAQSELAAETGASSRTASDAYREVSAMGESDQSGDENRVSSFEPVSA